MNIPPPAKRDRTVVAPILSLPAVQRVARRQPNAAIKPTICVHALTSSLCEVVRDRTQDAVQLHGFRYDVNTELYVIRVSVHGYFSTNSSKLIRFGYFLNVSLHWILLSGPVLSICCKLFLLYEQNVSYPKLNRIIIFIKLNRLGNIV